ncbi:MAG: tetratricopeptide repeat protein, partial [Bacteroidota bacterium]|nr:tetratricopeptide repeat protein [Bacteroidota bacterium]
SLNNLAALYQSMGDHNKALPLIQQSLKITESSLGCNHTDYADSLNNLAGLYQSMGEHNKALLLLQQSLKIIESSLGFNHADYADSLNNLAALYRSMGEHNKALPLFQQSLKIRESSLGSNHPDYAVSLNNLAFLYQSMGEHNKALPLYQQSLKIRESSLGSNHPDYADSLNNLALLYQSMGDHNKTLLLLQQQFSIIQQISGEMIGATCAHDRAVFLSHNHHHMHTNTSLVTQCFADDQPTCRWLMDTLIQCKSMDMAAHHQWRMAQLNKEYPSLSYHIGQLVDIQNYIVALQLAREDEKRIQQLIAKVERWEEEFVRIIPNMNISHTLQQCTCDKLCQLVGN